jgi:pimeloyl-ACP methyl ester carboxylesterase
MKKLFAASRAESPCKAGVVLLHGIAGTSLMLRKLERALRRNGFATLNLNYASRKKPLERLADDIHSAIAEFMASQDGPIHFVVHSMGGLLARVYIAKYRPARLGRVVMLGTPNGGSEIADRLNHLPAYRAYFGPAGSQLLTTLDPTLAALPPLDYPVGIIAGNRFVDPISAFFLLPWPNDGRVSVASSRLADMTDHTTVKASHIGLLRHPLAISQTIAFLSEGHFALRRPARNMIRWRRIGRRRDASLARRQWLSRDGLDRSRQANR